MAFTAISARADLDWRKPWSWPRGYQRGVKALAVCVGLGLLMPMNWRTWQAWRDAREGQTAVHAQERNTHVLRQATVVLQQARDTPDVRWGDAAALTASHVSSGLQWTQQTMASPRQTPPLTAIQLQQVPVHLQAQGSWRAWLQWLAQWPQVAPGVALESLVLAADGPAGVRADMAVWVTQHTVPAKVGVAPLASSADVPGGPFDTARWTALQQQQAQQHASYHERVVPQLHRTREPLEFVARERLRYVGQISKGADVQALVRVEDLDAGATRSGSVELAPIHRVQVGAYVGQHFGRVSAITAEAVWVKELVLAPSGEWVHRDIHLALQAQVP